MTEEVATGSAPDRIGAPDRSRRTAAWGLRLLGVPGAAPVLSIGNEDWPELRVTVGPLDDGTPAEPARTFVSDAACQLDLLGGGRLAMERDPLEARLALPSVPLDECVVQPHLSSAATVAGLWLGREVFHAGAFVVADRAWAVLGDKGDGKSTTLGWLARHGATIITDDALVIADGEVLAGPRCIDLRPEAARHLRTGTDLGVVGTRERWRIHLGDCASSYPFRGWIALEWGVEPAVAVVPSAERLRLLLAHRALMVPWMSPASILSLVARPVLRWRRPPGLTAMDEALPRLLAALEDHA